MSSPGDARVCFLALRVPEELAQPWHDAVRRSFGDAAADFRFSRPEGWHVTLFYLGATEASALGALVRHVGSALHALRAPALELAAPGAFPGPGKERVLWLGAREIPVSGRELEALHAAVLDGLDAFGQETGDERRRPYVPHVTVARPRRRGARVPETFYALRPDGRWHPAAVELLESVRGNGPARYETLEVFPFRS